MYLLYAVNSSGIRLSRSYLVSDLKKLVKTNPEQDVRHEVVSITKSSAHFFSLRPEQMFSLNKINNIYDNDKVKVKE